MPGENIQRNVQVRGFWDVLADATLRIAGTVLSRGSILRIGAAGIVEQLVAKTAAQILVGDGTDVVSVAVSGEAALSAAGVATVPGAVRLISKAIGHADLTAAATSEAIAFDDDIPAKALVIGSWFDLETDFSGGSVSALVVDVGDGTDPDGYVDNEDVFTGAANGQRSTPTTAPALLNENGVDLDDAARTPEVLITSTGDNVANLTAGALTAYIAFVTTPAGSAIS